MSKTCKLKIPYLNKFNIFLFLYIYLCFTYGRIHLLYMIVHHHMINDISVDRGKAGKIWGKLRLRLKIDKKL